MNNLNNTKLNMHKNINGKLNTPYASFGKTLSCLACNYTNCKAYIAFSRVGYITNAGISTI